MPRTDQMQHCLRKEYPDDRHQRTADLGPAHPMIVLVLARHLGEVGDGDR
jgi:hypothetical protein